MATILLNRILENREKNDYYATPPNAIELFLENYHSINNLKKVWEPACGEGAISKVLEDHLIEVQSSDLIDRNYGFQLDFLKATEKFNGSIITNPPFKIAKIFIEKALSIIPENEKCIMLLRLQFLESQNRKKLLEKYLEDVYIHSKRIACAKNGDWTKKPPAAISYAWFVFSKTKNKATQIHWL